MTPVTDAAPRFGSQHLRRKTARSLVAGFGVIVLTVGTGWWVTHPERFDPTGGGVGTDIGVVGEPLLAGAGVYPSDEVVLREVRPHVSVNTAAADIEVFVCRSRGENGVGLVPGTAEAECGAALPVRGRRVTRMRVGGDGQVIVQITAHQKGEVVIDGFDVTYSRGLQRGTERTGSVVTLSVSRDS